MNCSWGKQQYFDISFMFFNYSFRWVHSDGRQGRQERPGRHGHSHHSVQSWSSRDGRPARHDAGERLRVLMPATWVYVSFSVGLNLLLQVSAQITRYSMYNRWAQPAVYFGCDSRKVSLGYSFNYTAEWLTLTHFASLERSVSTSMLSSILSLRGTLSS